MVLILYEHAFKSVAALELSCDFPFQLRGNIFLYYLFVQHRNYHSDCLHYSVDFLSTTWLMQNIFYETFGDIFYMM